MDNQKQTPEMTLEFEQVTDSGAGDDGDFAMG
jgi:hypothetical protein